MSNQDEKNQNNQYQQPQQPQQQPNGYQQPNVGYQQQPYAQQPYMQQPQPQPVYVLQNTSSKASEAEKNATFSAGGSLFMLILCIVGTINLLTGLIGKVLSLDIGGILLYVLEILIVVGMWITFANAKKHKLSSTGISLIRIPYIIQFVFAVIGFVGNLVIWIFTFNIVSLIIGILTFIFECICFASVNKTLKLARDINQDKSVLGRKAGIFAAVAMIIFASLTLISEIVSYLMIEALKAAIESTGAAFLGMLLGGGGVITLVVAVVAFIADICGAIVILQFAKKVKQAING